MSRKLFAVILYLMCVLGGFAQDIEVKKFEPLEKDLTAVTSPRKDINGNACGLVKVALKEAGAEFEGNVMGEVQFTGKEYLVYLPNGTKRLGIKHPDYLPTTIVFADYGIKRVASSTTYELKVKTNKKKSKVDNSKKGMAVFNIKPSNAMLMIDGQIADGSGGAYTLSLPYGNHYYTIKLKDFSLNNQAVHIDKNAKTVNVDLTEFFAKVDVSCKTEDAEILINGESLGMGKWEGSMVPGKCEVEIVKSGYHPQSKTMELMENDSVRFDFPSLKMISGFLNVNYTPNGSEIYVNGEKIGVTPLQKELPVGGYKVEIKREGYLAYTNEIKIADGKEMFVNGELTPTQLLKLFMDAEEGNAYAQKCLADFFEYGSDNLFENDAYWDFAEYTPDYQKAKTEGLHIDKDIPKCIEWLKKSLDTFNSSSKYSESDRKYESNNICYRLMKIYLLGDGIKQDHTQSFIWAGKAGKDGEYWLAWHYFYGRGVLKNLNKALEYLNKSVIVIPEFSSSYKQYSTINNEILNKVGFKLGNKDILDKIEKK